MASQYVHLFISTLHFPHADQADLYRLKVQDWIRGNVSACEASLFIFDEIDKMPAGMIDGIKPFIDHHSSVEGVDFRRAIFLFLSNTGGRDITREAVRVWEAGRERESLQYRWRPGLPRPPAPSAVTWSRWSTGALSTSWAACTTPPS
jgi:hypothetical protein